MKAILEFELPEDKNEFDIIRNGMDWALAIWEFDQKLRNILKYNYKDYDYDTVERLRGELREFLEVYNLTLEIIQ